MGAARQLVAHPDKQKQRNADIDSGDALPVDTVVQEDLVVLPQRDDQVEHKGENRNEREKAGAVRQIFKAAALFDIVATEAIVADGDAELGDKAGHARGIRQSQINFLITELRGQEAEACHHGGRHQRLAATVENNARAVSAQFAHPAGKGFRLHA